MSALFYPISSVILSVSFLRRRIACIPLSILMKKKYYENIEILKAMIKDNFEEQRKLMAKLETALEAVTSFNGKQMLDSRDMRLMLKVCDRTLIRWRNSGKLPFFKLSGKIYFWASDVYKFLREECLNEDFISDSINS